MPAGVRQSQRFVVAEDATRGALVWRPLAQPWISTRV